MDHTRVRWSIVALLALNLYQLLGGLRGPSRGVHVARVAQGKESGLILRLAVGQHCVAQVGAGSLLGGVVH